MGSKIQRSFHTHILHTHIYKMFRKVILLLVFVISVSYAAPAPGNVFDSVGDAVNDMGDAIGDAADDIKNLGETNKAVAYINGICPPFTEPRWTERLDFDSDCYRYIRYTIGNTTREFDALWLWGLIIGLILGSCICGGICCCRK